MKSPAFSYYEAKDLADAINIKKSDDDAVILAGGQSLLPTLNMRLSSPSVLIDIGNINELKKIKVEDSYLIIGAMCSHSEIMNNKEVNEKLPILNKIYPKLHILLLEIKELMVGVLHMVTRQQNCQLLLF